jgi:AbrB family looped-hinge helix DNA binding protein
MDTNVVTLSSKYQVVIPHRIRESANLRAGTSFEVILYDNRIELIPLQPLKTLKGIFKGIDTTITRESDRL